MILVTGAKGQLGTDILVELSNRSLSAKGVDVCDFDITDKNTVNGVLQALRPKTVIHCAAYTAVDKAEDESELCFLINEEGTRNIAQACKHINAKMIYISTDYVFAGKGEHFYKPYDQTLPLSAYGASKLAGEKAVLDTLDEMFIVRISWVFGKNGNNFVKTMLRLGHELDSINIVSDQIGSPTYTVDLARLLCDMACSTKFGIYHATNEGECSWSDFAKEIFLKAGMSTKVNPIPATSYPTKAIRPYNSRLDKTCLDESGFLRLPHWKDALSRYFDN